MAIQARRYSGSSYAPCLRPGRYDLPCKDHHACKVPLHVCFPCRCIIKQPHQGPGAQWSRCPGLNDRFDRLLDVALPTSAPETSLPWTTRARVTWVVADNTTSNSPPGCGPRKHRFWPRLLSGNVQPHCPDFSAAGPCAPQSGLGWPYTRCTSPLNNPLREAVEPLNDWIDFSEGRVYILTNSARVPVVQTDPR